MRSSCSATTSGDGLAAQRGVEHVRGDLRVEGDGGRGRVEVVADPGDQQRLDLVCDDRDRRAARAGAAARAASCGPSTAMVRPSAPARASATGDPRRGRGSSRSSPTPTAACAASQGSSAAIPLPRSGPRSATDRRSRRPARPGGRPAPRRWSGPAGSRRRRAPPLRRSRRCGRARHGIEIERQLESAAFRRRRDRSRRPPAGRARGPGDAGRGHGPVGRDAAQGLGRVPGRLAGHRRQALDQRAELVLAEEADHGLAVVVAEPRRLEVELDRQVAHDRREVRAP